ncbi:hypothetical protein CH373_16375 [Leptospira perolatii]|uniref:Uncharacterized protein n=1 Tax=Leptospira perolatii TaxID=2023191 RepID=A0A2M9ZJ80_9LEPT|nr:hypothetical protein [Leptospira perolatii]PJZ69519.1 hypothetical protein CH360_10975 [Leptospira perolatii]PJZ72034.1 hypothetical protein CH373_16375 [Leptospira perolatii]
MKKIFTIILYLSLLPACLLAFSETDELLMKEATTPELKKIAKEFFIKKAKDHRDLAERYKAMAAHGTGGKSNAQDEEKKKYKKLADHCVQEAEKYEAQAAKY